MFADHKKERQDAPDAELEAMQTDRSKPWAEPTYWPMVMPNLGRLLHLDTMIAGYRAAKEKGEEEERRWASQHLNIEIGLALQSDNWVGADFWAASPAHISSLAELKARCEVVDAWRRRRRGARAGS